MKILIVGNARYVAQYGGGEVYVKNLIDALTARAHEVIYFSVGSDHVDLNKLKLNRYSHKSFEEFQLTFPETWLKHVYFGQVLERVTLFLCEIKPDVVHAHAWKQLIVTSGAITKIPTVITAHHGGIVCPAGALLNFKDEICSIPVSDRNCLRCCIKAVPGYQVWYPLIRLLPFKARLLAGDLFEKLPFVLFLTPLAVVSKSIQSKQKEIRDIEKFANYVIAPSPAIGQSLVLNGVTFDKIRFVPHGIPLPKIDMKRNPIHAPLRIIYVGRINYVKGLHVLLSACSGLAKDKYELYIIGEASTNFEKKYEKKLHSQFETVNAIWKGKQNRDEINSLLNESDVMVHPAIFLEVFGLTIAESLAVGCPVVATRCGGSEIQIQDGINGFLVPPNDAEALRKTLQHLINSPELIHEMSSRSGSVRSIEEHVVDIEKVYEACIYNQEQNC